MYNALVLSRHSATPGQLTQSATNAAMQHATKDSGDLSVFVHFMSMVPVPMSLNKNHCC